MKYIAPIAVVGIVLLQLSGAVPDASVGGPMTIALAFFIATLALGVHDAWSKKRGVLGWIVSIFVSIVGGFLAAMIGSTLMEPLLQLFPVQGSLASSGHPMLYVSLACMMLITLAGSWLALSLVGRMRREPRGANYV